MLATTGLWITIGVLGGVLLAWMAGLFLLLAMGRLCLDLGWGRSMHPLGPITVRIAAPRKLVLEMISAPYLGRTPGAAGVEVLARDQRLAVASHHTKVHFYDARTIEVVEVDPPDRVGFRHLAGPVPHAVERFVLTESDGATELSYDGELGIDFFALGRIAARFWVRPQWEGTVREHLEDLRTRAEQRADRQARRSSETEE